MCSALLRLSRPAVAGLVLVLVCFASGCGGGKGTVSGKVYYRDQLLGGGTVTFTNADGKGSQVATIQPDGSYTAGAHAQRPGQDRR